MQIVIPMAGLGQRFLAAGYNDIKPLIAVSGRPIISYVSDFFPKEEDFLFIVNTDHLKQTEIINILKKLKPQSKVVEAVHNKLGPVESVIQALEHIKDEEPVIFSYCDYNMLWNYEHFKNFVQITNADGIVVSYSGFHPHLNGPNFYAGVNTEKGGKILEVKEKHSFNQDKEKSWHSAGMYYFKSGKLAKKYFQKHIEGKPHENGEYYISTVYNELIKDGLSCYNYPINFFCQWGTPEDLEEYNHWIERVKNNYEPNNEHEKRTLKYWKEYLIKSQND